MRDRNVVTAEGLVEEALPGLLFRVKTARDQREILAHLGGKMKMNRIRVIPGDRVLVELHHPLDTRGRIVRRL